MPILNPDTLEFFSRSAQQTRRLGLRLGKMLKKGDLLCFSGDLGAGKTTFVNGIAEGWGTFDNVTSPTFVLVNEYSRMDKNVIFHMDAYRIASDAEAEELDLDRMNQNGILMIEWAERIQAILPKEHLWINMRWISDEQRKITLLPSGKRYCSLVQHFKQETFGVTS